jgi:hypothetical protein
MKREKRCFAVLLLSLLLLGLMGMSAGAEDVYEDGSYTVPFSMEGLGRHNIAWDTATVTVENGLLYVDFTLERVDPRDQAPQFDWISTACGTFVPEIDNANFICVFSRIQVPKLGRVEVTVQTSAMSMPYEIDYTIVIDGSSIPLKAPEPTPAPTPEPTPEPTPTPPALLKDTITDEMLAGAKRPEDGNWYDSPKTKYVAAEYMLAMRWGPSMAYLENGALYRDDPVEALAEEGDWTLIRAQNGFYRWVVTGLLTETPPAGAAAAADTGVTPEAPATADNPI